MSCECIMLEVDFLILIQLIVVDQEIIGSQEKSTRTAGRIGNRLAWFGVDSLYHCLNKGAWREILPSAGFGIFRVLLQQTFIDIAFNIRAHRDPFGIIHHVYQAKELGRVLDFVLGLGENLTEHSLFAAKLLHKRHIMDFQLRSSFGS